VIFEHHRLIDQLRRALARRGPHRHDGRGIGPCYADKAARTGLRGRRPPRHRYCRTRLRAALAEKNALLVQVHRRAGRSTSRASSTATRARRAPAALRLRHGRAGARGLQRGQAHPLRGRAGRAPRHRRGTYPFVTSSNTGRTAFAPALRSAAPLERDARASPRPTAPASAKARSRPSRRTRSASGSARPATSTARRPDGRGAAAGSTRSRCATRWTSRAPTAGS
jgi:hypothetical protein